VQTIFISPLPVENNYVKSHKKAFWAIAVLFTILLASISVSVAQYYFGPPAAVRISTVRGTGQVKIDSGEAFELTYQTNLPSGSHSITVTDGPHASYSWKDTIMFNRGTLTSIDLDLGPTSDFNGAVVLSLTRGSDLEIHSSPDKAEAFLDGTDLGPATVKRRVPSPGTHTITLKKDGYLEKNFQVNITSNFNLRADVKLFKNPSFTINQIKSEAIKPTTSSDLQIIDRNNSDLAKIAGDTTKTATQIWTSVQFLHLDATDPTLSNHPLDWLKGLYYHSIVHLKLPDIPFQYLIDTSGKIYEGRAGGKDSITFDPTDSLDFASKSPVLQAGIVYVGYLGQKGSVTPQASESFEKLVVWLGRGDTSSSSK
jgi:hypothetical protein